MRAAGGPDIPIKRTRAQTYSLKITCSELQCWGSSSKGIRDIQGGTKLASGRGLAEQLSSRQKCWLKPLFPCCALLPPSLHMQADTISEIPSPWLAPFTCPGDFPETLPNPTCRHTQAASSGFSIQMVCLGSCYRLS